MPVIIITCKQNLLWSNTDCITWHSLRLTFLQNQLIVLLTWSLIKSRRVHNMQYHYIQVLQFKCFSAIYGQGNMFMTYTCIQNYEKWKIKSFINLFIFIQYCNKKTLNLMGCYTVQLGSLLLVLWDSLLVLSSHDPCRWGREAVLQHQYEAANLCRATVHKKENPNYITAEI